VFGITSSTVDVSDLERKGRQDVTRLVQWECRCRILSCLRAEMMDARNIGCNKTGGRTILRYLFLK
jgi:hypothetical protein